MKRAAVLILSFCIAFQAHAQWQRVADGVEYQHIRRGPLDAHVARIDLDEARVIATRKSERGLTVSEYAKKTNALIAINADYFDEQQRPIGTAIGGGRIWWRGMRVPRKQGLVAFGKKRAEIQANTQRTGRWMRAAVSGWPMLVRDCSVIEKLPGSDFFTHAPHPRTAVGLSEDRKTAYFVVADGRREGVPGPTLPELASFLRELGACEAMNLDGGGSSAFWLRDAIVNIPSDGKERKVGNHLAVVGK